MSTNSLLTAIILSFNNEDTIERCINSIVAQNTNYEYEIHIYDDCSLDKNAEICRNYAERYPDKIKFFPQHENTFLKAYKQTQAYKSIQNISSKYFCIIEGDDYWCDDSKLQVALDFLEQNPEYIGFAHDTLQVDEADGSKASWVHDKAKYTIENPVTLDDRFIFLMTSARIFRSSGFENVGIWPVDYLVYHYHLARGPIFYFDKIMSVYTLGTKGTWATLGNKTRDMNSMFPYKVLLLLGNKFDAYCTNYLKKFDTANGFGLRYYRTLLFLKKYFGVTLGWKLWFIFRFVRVYNWECMDINYVFPRKDIKQASDKLYKK